jgi:hypothetical protein
MTPALGGPARVQYRANPQLVAATVCLSAIIYFDDDQIRIARISLPKPPITGRPAGARIQRVILQLHKVTIIALRILATHQCDLSVAVSLLITAAYLGMILL